MNSNSTPGSAGDTIRRSQPAAARATDCSSRGSGTTRPRRSSSSSRAIDVPSAVAMRSSTSTVGALRPRSIS